MNLPEKIKSLTPYPPMTDTPAVRLDGNESCFCLPDRILNDIAEAIRQVPLHRYPDPYAAGVCCLAERFWNAPEGSAVAGNGSDELISIALSALLPRGGRLLVCDPDFSMYRFYASLCELECVGLNRFSGVPDVDEIIRKGSDANAVILSNPCNPTGQGISDARRIVEALPCPVLIDEAYMDFWGGGEASVLPYINRYSNLLVLKTCSKNLAMAGLRLGFAFAGQELVNILRSAKSPYNVSSLTQAAGAAALRHPGELRENTRLLVAAKDRLYARLSDWCRSVRNCTVTDTVTNFVLLSCPNAEAVYKKLHTQGVAVRYICGLLRITAGTDLETDSLIGHLNVCYTEGTL